MYEPYINSRINKLIKKAWSLRGLRFLLVGATNTLVGLATFPIIYLSTEKYNIHYEVILLVSWVISTAFSFVSNKKLVFYSSGGFIGKYIKYMSFQSVFFVLNALVLGVGTGYFHSNPMVVQFIIGLLSMSLGYFYYVKVAFK